MRDINYTGHFKYGEIRRVLSDLGFEEHTGTNEFNAPFRAFYHRKTDALVTLPDKPDTTTLEPVYLRIAERAVEEWGIANSETFFKLLREATPTELQVA